MLHEVFDALHLHYFVLEHMLLKPNMVLPGKAQRGAASSVDVAARTLQVLHRTVPPAVAGIFFPSGGQTPVETSANLNAINRLGGAQPCPLSFSYGRTPQEPVLQAWRGQAANVRFAQEALLERARLNSAARDGRYGAATESTD